MVKHEALKNHLETLRNSIPELRGVLLASTEGLPVAHSLSNGTDPNRVAAMAAAASNLGRRISESMATGGLSEVSIRGDDGVLIVYSANEHLWYSILIVEVVLELSIFPNEFDWAIDFLNLVFDE